MGLNENKLKDDDRGKSRHAKRSTQCSELTCRRPSVRVPTVARNTSRSTAAPAGGAWTEQMGKLVDVMSRFVMCSEVPKIRRNETFVGTLPGDFPFVGSHWVSVSVSPHGFQESVTSVSVSPHGSVSVSPLCQCRLIQHNTIQHNTIQHNTIQYNTKLYKAIQHNPIQYDITH